MIKFHTENVVSVQDLDKLVQETYGRVYRFQQQDGCMNRQNIEVTIPSPTMDFENDTLPEVINGEEMGVSFKAWLERDPKEWNGLPADSRFIDLFWKRNFYPNVQMVLNDLHAKGLWPAGEYLIIIDW